MKPGSEVYVMRDGKRRKGTVVKIPGYKQPTGTIAVEWDKADRPHENEARSIVSKTKIVGER